MTSHQKKAVQLTRLYSIGRKRSKTIALYCPFYFVRLEVKDYSHSHNPCVYISMKCKGCQEELKGKQVKWCSQKCKNQDTNNRHLSYEGQKRRRFERKKKFVLLKGGCCSKCGYDKSLRALSFHHRNPEEKEFILSARELGMYKEERLLNEVNKCDLLCANCHMEEHASDEMMNWK